MIQICWFFLYDFNRPGISWLFYQNLCDSFIHSLSDWSCSSKSSRHLQSQAVWARDLKFLENVHLPPCVICHMSHVMCHMSCVTCHVSCVMCHMSCVICHMSQKHREIAKRCPEYIASWVKVSNCIFKIFLFKKKLNKLKQKN